MEGVCKTCRVVTRAMVVIESSRGAHVGGGEGVVQLELHGGRVMGTRSSVERGERGEEAGLGDNALGGVLYLKLSTCHTQAIYSQPAPACA